MTNRPAPKIAKWPFVLADIALLAVGTLALYPSLPPKSTMGFVAVIGAFATWMFGAWICVKPWLDEFRAQTRQLENDTLNDSVQQIARIEEVAARVQSATGSWQTAQDSAARTTATAKDIEEKMRAQLKEFMEFNERIDTEEKKRLTLEVEKLRRVEAEWLQVSARMLDHTFALAQAAARSGQANLAAQMANFQNACRDAARRVGLIPFVPVVGDRFDERGQQLEDPNAKPAEDAVISEILATGFTFQGQLLRKALVRVETPQAAPQESSPTQEAETPAAETPAEEPSEETTVAEEPSAEENNPASEADTVVTEKAPEPEPAPENFEPEPEQKIESQEPETFTIVAVEAAGSDGTPTPAAPKPRRARKQNLQESLPF